MPILTDSIAHDATLCLHTSLFHDNLLAEVNSRYVLTNYAVYWGLSVII
jgi:hypothetical protein